MQFTYGVTTGLGIYDCWTNLFQQNETSINKMTDRQIAEFMGTEFPNHDSAMFRDIRSGKLWRVQQMRSRYNRGGLTGEKPIIRSHRYNEAGSLCDPNSS